MYGTLMRAGNEYKLFSAQDESCIGTTKESPYNKLNKEKCDEIFSDLKDVLTCKVEISRINQLNMETGTFDWSFVKDEKDCLILKIK